MACESHPGHIDPALDKHSALPIDQNLSMHSKKQPNLSTMNLQHCHMENFYNSEEVHFQTDSYRF